MFWIPTKLTPILTDASLGQSFITNLTRHSIHLVIYILQLDFVYITEAVDVRDKFFTETLYSYICTSILKASYVIVLI